MALLTKIEDIVSIPMEVFHRQKGFHPVDLSRSALRCLEQGCRRGIKQIYAPNRFDVRLCPEDYKELQSFLSVIRSDISGELRRVISERKYLLAGELKIEIIEDPEVQEGKPRVDGYMQGENDNKTTIELPEEISEGFNQSEFQNRFPDKKNGAYDA